MDVYVLDSLLRPSACVDDYESLIWTERFSDAGDFELKLSSTPGNRNLFTAGTRLAIEGSTRVMTVETVQDDTSSNGEDILNVKGPSLEALMKDRVAYNNQNNLTTNPGWTLTGTAGEIARAIFNWVCIDGHLDSHDVIPFAIYDDIYNDTNMPESTTELSITITPANLYDTIKSLCDSVELGFRFSRIWSGGMLFCYIYAGRDLTTRQSYYTPVIFAADMDDLQNTSELTVIENSKNVAYVYGPAGFQIVYGEHVPSDVDGFDRRVLYVDGSSVSLTDPDISGSLTQLGVDALMANRATEMFDGEVNQYGRYVYDIDYRVGDLVEVRNKDGIVTYKRVTEQIFVSDENGDRSYPTLTADVFAGTEDWLAYDSDPRAWADLTDSTAWADMT